MTVGELLLIVALGAEPAPRGTGSSGVKFNWRGGRGRSGVWRIRVRRQEPAGRGQADVSKIIGAAGVGRPAG